MTNNAQVVVPGFASRFITSTEIVDKWGVNLVVYGQPGVGKTTFAATAQDSPHGKDVLFVDLEGGTRSVTSSGVTVFKPQAWTDLQELGEYLLTEKHSFKTIVLDTITEAQRLGLDHVMTGSKTPDLPGLQDYGKSNEQIVRLIRFFRNLAHSEGWNVIFIAQEVEIKDESSGALVIRPALTPKAAEGIAQAVDGIARLTIKNGKRVLNLAPTAYQWGKWRQPQDVPPLPTELENPSMAQILAHVRTVKKKANI